MKITDKRSVIPSLRIRTPWLGRAMNSKITKQKKIYFCYTKFCEYCESLDKFTFWVSKINSHGTKKQLWGSQLGDGGFLNQSLVCFKGSQVGKHCSEQSHTVDIRVYALLLAPLAAQFSCGDYSRYLSGALENFEVKRRFIFQHHPMASQTQLRTASFKLEP